MPNSRKSKRQSLDSDTEHPDYLKQIAEQLQNCVFLMEKISTSVQVIEKNQSELPNQLTMA